MGPNLGASNIGNDGLNEKMGFESYLTAKMHLSNIYPDKQKSAKKVLFPVE